MSFSCFKALKLSWKKESDTELSSNNPTRENYECWLYIPATVHS